MAQICQYTFVNKQRQSSGINSAKQDRTNLLLFFNYIFKIY